MIDISIKSTTTGNHAPNKKTARPWRSRRFTPYFLTFGRRQGISSSGPVVGL